MSFEDNYQVTSKFSEHVHDFLSSHLIAPTPSNYAVVYLYISNENELLSAAIDRQLQKGEAIDANFLDDLFSRYVSFSQQVDKEKKAANSLKKLDKILTNTEHHAPLENIVSYLFSTINNAKSQRQTLSQELTSTQQEINQLKEKLASSREEALVDSLTGLLNRRGCDEKLQALNLNDTHSSLAIDIDHFKAVNDKFGHFIGDKVIQRIAKTIKDHIGKQDLAVRFGGEEFVVIMSNKTLYQAKEVAELIRNSIANMKLIQRETNTYLPRYLFQLVLRKIIIHQTG